MIRKIRFDFSLARPTSVRLSLFHFRSCGALVKSKLRAADRDSLREEAGGLIRVKRDFLQFPSFQKGVFTFLSLPPLFLSHLFSPHCSANSSRSQIATRFKEAKVGSVSSASSFLKPQGHPAASGQTVRQTLTAASAKVSNRCARARSCEIKAPSASIRWNERQTDRQTGADGRRTRARACVGDLSSSSAPPRPRPRPPLQ